MAASPEGHGPVGMALAARMYVEHVRDLRLHEMAVSIELTSLRDGMLRAQSLAPTFGGGQAHGDDSIFATIEKMQDLEAELAQAMAEVTSERREFLECLSEMPDPVHRTIMTMRADGATWREIGEAIYYSKRQTLRVAEAAYISLWAVMPEPWRRLAFPDAEPRDDTKWHLET